MKNRALREQQSNGQNDNSNQRNEQDDDRSDTMISEQIEMTITCADRAHQAAHSAISGGTTRNKRENI